MILNKLINQPSMMLWHLAKCTTNSVPVRLGVSGRFFRPVRVFYGRGVLKKCSMKLVKSQ